MRKKVQNEKIDFVITWVDGEDPKWLKEKTQYEDKKNINNNKCRYRDMETLKYWFRSIEKYTPWVNHIYFITYGHLPNWLNLKNEKLKIIKHTDYIPEKYLPTYNSNVIELNIHRIKDLSENFVLFNDDVFITKPMKEKDFFKENLPCEEYAENILTSTGYHETFSHICQNNMGIVNKYFNKRKVMKKHLTKYINLKYGINNIRTICLLPWKKYSLIYDSHLVASMKKSQLKELWKLEPIAFETTCSNRFRKENDINQYLIRYFQLLRGNFIPRRHGIGKMITLSNDNQKIIQAIKKQKYKILCINDTTNDFNFEKSKKEIIDAFEFILPEKSSFEK